VDLQVEPAITTIRNNKCKTAIGNNICNKKGTIAM
jgi:hypothetical protein